MYHSEWSAAQLRHKHEPGSAFDKIQQKMAHEEQKSLLEDDVKDTEVWENRSSHVDDNHAVYAFNHEYIDVCTNNDSRRGLFTMAAIFFCYIIFFWSSVITRDIYILLIKETQSNNHPPSIKLFILLPIGIATIITVIYLFFRYVIKIWRLEAWTMRRLVVRFHHKSKTVIFLRPAHLGGTVSYRWEDMNATLPKDVQQESGLGGVLMLAVLTTTENPHSRVGLDCAFIGTTCNDYPQLLAFWEYLRRFMQGGPNAVPPPRRLRSKWPSPLGSIYTVSKLGLPSSGYLSPGFIVLRLLMLPAFVIWGAMHYLSLLLCYEPRFPKAIRRACGESELRSLLAMIAYNLLPLLYSAAALWLLYVWRYGDGLPQSNAGWW